MNLIRIFIAGPLLLVFIVFKVDKASFGNMEWLALGIFVLLYFVAILLAALLDNSNMDSDNIAALLEKTR